MIISAIDLGFMYTKALIHGRPVLIKSVVGNSKPQRFNDLNMGLKNDVDNLKCRVGNTEYFVSDLAIDQSDTVYHSLKDDRFDSDATEVLVKTSFALALGNDNISTAVVSGLPVSHYAPYKENISNLFLNKIHNFEVVDHGNLIRGSASVTHGKFIPQPFGAQVGS